MSLRPFFSFYGGKWRAAPHYPAPEHRIVVEPFAGSGGYSVRHAAREVRLYDLDEKVIATWQYLIRATEREIRALPLMGPRDNVNDLRVTQEARWLIGWWLNKGTTAPCNVPSRWMREPMPGRLETYWGAAIRERLARQVSAIRHWRSEVRSWDSVPDVGASWFVDPPYSGTPGVRYTHGNRSIDYRALGEWCLTRRGQVMVCENVGADWLPFEPFMVAKTTAGHGRARVSKEALWQGGVSA